MYINCNDTNNIYRSRLFPDGVTMIPWSRSRCVAWDVTAPDTFAATHLPLTSIAPSAAADRVVTKKR